MTYPIFCEKLEKDIISLSSAEFAHIMVRVNVPLNPPDNNDVTVTVIALVFQKR